MSLTNDKIAKWKNEYDKIYKIAIEGDEYVYRVLSIGECERAQSIASSNKSHDTEEYLLGTALLYPEEIETRSLPAGVIAALAQHIMTSAGFFNESDFMESVDKAKKEYDGKRQDQIYQWKLIILTTLPGYTFKEISRLSLVKFLELIHICEELKGEKFIGGSTDSQLENVKETKRAERFLGGSDLTGLTDEDA